MLLNWTEFVLYVGVLNENSANIQGENCMAGHTTSHVNSFFGQITYRRTVSKLRKNSILTQTIDNLWETPNCSSPILLNT